MGSMDEFLGRKYKLKSSERFEEYMKFIEVGLISRKTAAAVSPVLMLTKNDEGVYTYQMLTSIRTITTKFRLGEEFDETRADGVKVRSVVTFDGNKLLQTHVESNGRRTHFVRIFTPEQVHLTITCEGWDGRCVRIFEHIN